MWDVLCEQYGVTSIEKVDGGYARGYTHALTHWRKLLADLNTLRTQRGMCVILLAHAKVEKFEDPEHAAYDRYSPRLHKHVTALLTGTRRRVGVCCAASTELSQEKHMSDGNAKNTDQVGAQVEQAEQLLEEFAGSVQSRVRSSLQPDMDQLRNSFATLQKRVLDDLDKIGALSKETRALLSEFATRIDQIGTAQESLKQSVDGRIEPRLASAEQRLDEGMKQLGGDIARCSQETQQKHGELEQRVGEEVTKLSDQLARHIEEVRLNQDKFAGEQQQQLATARTESESAMKAADGRIRGELDRIVAVHQADAAKNRWRQMVAVVLGGIAAVIAAVALFVALQRH